MKKILLVFLLFFSILATQAQVPPFHCVQSPAQGLSSNAFPLNTPTSNKVQWIYNPQMFGSGGYTAGTGPLIGTPAFIGLIDTLWYRTASTNTTASFTGFEVSIGQNVGTQTNWTSGTYITGLTSCFGPTSFSPPTTPSTSGGWVAIPLTTPFLYNPNLSLVVEIRQSGYSPGLQSYQSTNTGSRRIWGAYAATTGSFGSGLVDLGLSLTSPLPCATPTNLTATSITQTTVNLGWTENNTPTPATTWQIEYGPQGFTPTGTPNITTTTNPHPLSGLNQNTSYDFYVRSYCGVGDSSYFAGPYTFTTLATCPWPTNLTATNVTASSADLNWTENGVATNWGIEIGLAGFSPTGNATFYTTTKPFTVGPLIGNASFEYYVRSVCGVGDSSVWTGPYQFTTPLAPLSCGSGNPSVLYYEPFNQTATTQSPLPTTWSQFRTSIPFWQTESNTTGSNCGATGGATATPGYAYFEASGSSNIPDTMTSPVIDLTTSTSNARVTFYYHMQGTQIGTVSLFVDNGTTLTQIWTLSGGQQTAQSDPWTLVDVSLASYVGQNIQLKFMGIASGCCCGDIGIDEITVEACVACAAPSNLVSSNITATTADLNWTENGTATAWDLEVIPSGSTPTGVPTHNNITVSGNPSTTPYTLTSLITYQAVDVYIRSDCGPDSSIWVGPITVLPCAALAGTYTIDASLPASTTNFTSFTAAATALQCGISAPVIFNVNPTPGPYTEQITIPQVIGSNATNTITFNGNGATITFAGSTLGSHQTILLNDADYITFNNLNVEATGTVGYAMHLTNGATHNEFHNCNFSVPANTTSTGLIPFVLSGSLTSYSGGSTVPCDSNWADSCTFFSGYFALTMYGNTSGSESGNKVTNSTIADFYAYGFYHLYESNLVFSGNNISRPTRTTNTTFYGVYASGIGNGNLYEKNHIHDPFAANTAVTSTMYGFYFFIDATSAAGSNVIQNNLIEDMNGNGTCYGIYSSTAQYLKVYHNTVSLDETASTATGATYGIYQAGTTALGQENQNNIVSISRGGTGTKYCIYLQAPTTNMVCNYNNLYMNAAAGTNNVGFFGTARATLLDWQTTGYGANSLSIDPLYVNTIIDDYHPGQSGLDDMGTPLGVVDDILGDPRSATTPDMGAFEFIVIPLDMGASAIISPDTTVGCYSNAETISVEIKNYGSDTVFFATNICVVTVNVTGAVTQTLTTFITTGFLAPTQTMVVSMPTTVNMTTNGAYAMNAYTTMLGDGNATNDALPFPYNYNVGVTTGTISASSNQLCFTGNPTLSLAGAYGGTIQWQESTISATGPWTNVGTNSSTYAPAAAVTQTTYYRAYAVCNTNSDTSSVQTIIVNTPTLTSVMHDTVDCGPNMLTLGAVGTTPTTQVSWYDAATGGTKLDTGLTFVTPLLSVTDTFYAEANDGGVAGLSHLTTMAAGNGSSGTMFSIKALGSPVTIDSFSSHCSTPASTMTTWEILYAPSDYLLTPGANTNAAFWTTLGTVSVPSAGSGTPTVLPLNLALTIPSGMTYSFQIACTSGSVSYTNGTTTGALWNSNADLEVYQGHGGGLNNMTNNPRIHNGYIYYSTGCNAPTRLPVYAVVNGLTNGDLANATLNNASSSTGSSADTTFHADGAGLTYYDASCNIICLINDALGANVLGNVVSQVTIDASVQVYNGQPYARRWYDLTPASQGAADITLYFTQADFDDYNMYATPNGWPLLPQNPTDAAGIANLRVTKVSGGGLGVGTPTVLTPNLVTWNATEMRWEVDLSVISFSQFYAHSLNPNNAALPVELVNFTVNKAGSVDLVNWQTSNEQNNAYFNVQRSANGVNYETIGVVNSKAPNGNSNILLSYEMIDEAPMQGHNYYRLEQVDLDGKKWYSNVIDIVWGDGGTVVIYPNPTKDVVNVDISATKTGQVEVKVMDMSGRVVKSVIAQSNIGMNNIQLNLSELASGVYTMQIIENNIVRFVDKVKKN